MMPLQTNSRPDRTAVIVQARCGSTRLPDKVLKILGKTTVLQHVLRRCKMIPSADIVICATTTGDREDAIAEIAEAEGIDVFRGSETDLLSRYHGAAEAAGADIIMRVTSDCPLIDPRICEDVLSLRRSEAADYSCNNMPPSWPHGLDCESFTMAALDAAYRQADDAYDREHVTPWIRRAKHLKQVNVARRGHSKHELRWTLDYPEDFKFFQALFERFPDCANVPNSEVLIQFLTDTPELLAINSEHARTPDQP